jgi:hypothetical protein
MRNKPAGAADAAIILATAPTIYDFSIRRAHRWCPDGLPADRARVTPSLVDEHAVVFRPGEVTMVRADFLQELRLFVDQLRADVDWVGIGLALAVGLTPWFIGLPEDPDLVTKTALAGVAIWGAP